MQGTDLVVAVDDDGFFKDKISEFNGLLVTDKETNKYVINAVKVSVFKCSVAGNLC
jgi:predicted NUDIX family phosphoesterase